MNNIFKINSNFENYTKLFLLENDKLNLISKNDEKFLFEKHIYDSLAIKLFFEKYKISPCQILDIGCGGGFPCVPIAIEYPDFQIIGIDSIQKKINSINLLRDKLQLDNLSTICDRVENLQNQKFKLIVSRAVGNLSKICEYALPLLKEDGFFVAYKSKKALEEIIEAQATLKKYNAKVLETINYNLPLEEVYERNLVIISVE